MARPPPPGDRRARGCRAHIRRRRGLGERRRLDALHVDRSRRRRPDRPTGGQPGGHARRHGRRDDPRRAAPLPRRCGGPVRRFLRLRPRCRHPRVAARLAPEARRGALAAVAADPRARSRGAPHTGRDREPRDPPCCRSRRGCARATSSCWSSARPGSSRTTRSPDRCPRVTSRQPRERRASCSAPGIATCCGSPSRRTRRSR